MKIAADFGFKTDNDGMKNAVALQEAVKGGGDIYISEPGVYEIADQVVLGDDTTLYFCAGSYLKRVNNSEENSYVFINSGAYTKTYNKNIQIIGLRLICNEVRSDDKTEKSKKVILGLRGHCSFFYIKDLVIRDFQCYDLPIEDFGIHICTFENVLLENLRIEGMKDAVHFGRGSKFVVRHGLFRTYDDPIALNGHDYVTSNPELGWIENGLIEDCYDLNADATVGYFCRILAGAWTDWREGMVVQRSDTVVCNNRLYRVYMPVDGKTYISNTPPTHEAGEKEYDGIVWAVVQDGASYGAGCKNIHFKDIYLQKNRAIAFSIHFDKDEYSRSYYPYSKSPIQENLLFENVVVQAEKIPRLLWSISPVENVRFVNCTLKNNYVHFDNIKEDGIYYPSTNLLFSGTKFQEELPVLVDCEEGTSAKISIVNSMNAGISSTVKGDTIVSASDISLKKYEKQ